MSVLDPSQRVRPDVAEECAAFAKQMARTLGFQHLGITSTTLSDDEKHLLAWLEKGRHGEMAYMARHGVARSRPDALVPGTISVLSARMDYLPEGISNAESALTDTNLGYISRYALGRDYHKVLRQRLQRLADTTASKFGQFGYRVFTDSAPVLEKALARNAGLGWIGKHTNLIDARSGSWFFLGEIYTDLALPTDPPSSDHCGTCTRCLVACPTQAIVAPYQVDARRCISYLTIELQGAIPLAFRKAIGNRIYGCDDCQLVCPWNKFARLSAEPDFVIRHGLDRQSLIDLFAWDETTFLTRTEGSAIRRIGYERWLRNIAIALGNTASSATVIHALRQRLEHPSELVREHVRWAIAQHTPSHD